MSIGDIYQLKLDSIASGGDAIGRFNGKTVFVEGGAPEETVTCRVTEDRDTYARAEILEINESSKVRVKPVCEFYNKCGGCNLQHIDYNAQLQIKENIVKDLFLKVGGIDLAELEQLGKIEVFPSPPFEYRNRIQFHCLREQAKKFDQRKYGLKGRKSSEIITVSDCPVAVPGIRELLTSFSPRSQNRDSVSDRFSSFVIPVEKDRFTVFSKDTTLISEGGKQRGKIKILDKEITVDAGMFFQSNCVMLEKLITALREIAGFALEESIAAHMRNNVKANLPMADLYCGVGTYAFFLHDLFPKIILAEENKNAISLARENLKGINAEYFALRDTDWEKTIFKEKAAFGFAVVDPPRAGLNRKAADALSFNGPLVLAYVSCDMASLARDAKILINGSYSLKDLKIFDFYPQTAHIESLAVFER